MSSPVETFQIPLETAEEYEAAFVPALFAEWAPHLVEIAGVAPGHRVLDVGCGTGVVARAVADHLGGRGTVVGLDLNEAMLTVARRIRPEIEWRQGNAAYLPFEAASFDRVLCQSALMFMPARKEALREMARVVTTDGTVAIQVWSSLAAQPAYRLFAEVVARHAGPEAVQMIGAYWVLGDLDELGRLFAAAGLRIAATRTRMGTMRLGSIDQMVTTEVESTPLIERIDEEVYRSIRADAHEVLRPFLTETGLVLPIEGHLIAARPWGGEAPDHGTAAARCKRASGSPFTHVQRRVGQAWRSRRRTQSLASAGGHEARIARRRAIPVGRPTLARRLGCSQSAAKVADGSGLLTHVGECT